MFLQLSDGIYVFANVTGIKLNATVIGHLFRNFVQKVASPKVSDIQLLVHLVTPLVTRRLGHLV
jgi:hypothetical protein